MRSCSVWCGSVSSPHQLSPRARRRNAPHQSSSGDAVFRVEDADLLAFLNALVEVLETLDELFAHVVLIGLGPFQAGLVELHELAAADFVLHAVLGELLLIERQEHEAGVERRDAGVIVLAGFERALDDGLRLAAHDRSLIQA